MSLFRNLFVGFSRRLSHKTTNPASLLKTHRRCLRQSCILQVSGTEITMPSLSPTMTEGTIVKWMKKEGESLQPGDVLCEIQTDKAVVGFETEEEGILAKILVGEDSRDVKVGTLIALMVEEGEDWKSVEVPAKTTPAESKPPAEPKPPAESTPAEPPLTPQQVKKIVTDSTATATAMGPSVHLLLEKYNLDPSSIPATGPRGNILKGDILHYITDKALKPVQLKTVPAPAVTPSTTPTPAAPTVTKPTTAEYIDIELSNMRKTIAKRLTQSKTTIPHSYGTIDCNIDALIATRKKLKSEGISVSVNDFIIKAVAVALQACPQMNVVWNGDQIVESSEVDISVAVATDAGLITPIIKNVASKGLVQISTSMKDLAARARENKLKLEEFQGGTFTISNLGMFGISEFSAIINPPQCGILAVGSGIPTVGHNGKIYSKMSATLSFDANGVSESTAAEFLDVLKDVLEDPALIILGGGISKQRTSVLS